MRGLAGGWEGSGYLKSFRGADTGYEGEQGLGGQWEPLVFGGAGTACEGKQGLGGQGVSVVFGEAGTACEGEQGLGGPGEPW